MKKKLRKKFTQLRNKKYFELTDVQVKIIYSSLSFIIKQYKITIVGSYQPIHSELNIKPVLKLLKKKCTIVLPRVLNKNNMEFRVWKKDEPFYVNKFGILEPSAKNKKVVPQLFLTPLLAFDSKFNRLGYGRGYYDKYLSKNKKFLTYGIAFSFQQTKKIPTDKSDVALKGIITEKGPVLKI
jgi:5-formyltetrahydrofolate cyclo-ligase